MKAIIVDDEPKAIELIDGYTKHFSSIEVVGTFRNAMKAYEFVGENPVDLVFLDINMPHLSGMSFSKLLAKDIKIIFTTAYSEYAAESYTVGATDYLLKPISLERFTQAISKVLTPKPIEESNSKIIVKSGSKIYNLAPNDIFFLKKDGNYIFYHLADYRIMARESITETLEKLPENFVQIHKSIIINFQHMQYVEKDEVSVHNTLLPVSSTYRQNLIDRI